MIRTRLHAHTRAVHNNNLARAALAYTHERACAENNLYLLLIHTIYANAVRVQVLAPNSLV
jgi:hypothetical protein